MQAARQSRLSVQFTVVVVLFSTLLACRTTAGPGTAPAVPVVPAAGAVVTEPVAAGQNPVTLVTPTPAGSVLVETPAAPAAPHPSWAAYRDPRYGYGIALPCWWPVTPTPLEGYSGVMTTRNYDDAFFQANSTKGWWTGGDWPAGVIKMDVGVLEGVPAGQSIEETLRQGMDPTLETIVGSQERAFGPHLGTVLEIDDPRNPAEPNLFVVVFRLGSDQLLRFVAFPGTAIWESDLQQIMNSLALTPEQPVQLPSVAPSPPQIDLPPGCQYP